MSDGNEQIIEAPAVSVRKELELVKMRLAEAERLYVAHNTLAIDMIQKHNKLVSDTTRIVTILADSNSKLLAALRDMSARLAILDGKGQDSLP
jgi:hypothetical protein